MSGRQGDTLCYKIGCVACLAVRSYTRRVRDIRPHAVHSQPETYDLLVGKGSQGGPPVFPNDTRIAQDSLFRVTSPKRSNRKESGIRLPLRHQAHLDEPTTFRKSRYVRFIPTRPRYQTDLARIFVQALQPSRVAEAGRRGRHFWPARSGFGWQGEHVLVRVHRLRFLPKGRELHWKCPMYLANFRVCLF